MKTVLVSYPESGPEISGDEAVTLLNSTTWYHSFEIRPGLRTPGGMPIDATAALDGLYVPAHLTGMKALDVGAWDGPLTFELERRGAHASALDVQDPAAVGFAVARRIIGSRSAHYQCSVYDLPFGELKDLDLVIFRGVYYHLKHPLLAFERLSAALKLGGTLHFEGEAFIKYAEDLDGEPVPAELLALARSNVPVCLSYPNRYKGASNWFVPNRACLESWLSVSGFTVNEMHEYTTDRPGPQRLFGYATKTHEAADMLEHPVY